MKGTSDYKDELFRKVKEGKASIADMNALSAAIGLDASRRTPTSASLVGVAGATADCGASTCGSTTCGSTSGLSNLSSAETVELAELREKAHALPHTCAR